MMNWHVRVRAAQHTCHAYIFPREPAAGSTAQKISRTRRFINRQLHPPTHPQTPAQAPSLIFAKHSFFRGTISLSLAWTCSSAVSDHKNQPFLHVVPLRSLSFPLPYEKHDQHWPSAGRGKQIVELISHNCSSFATDSGSRRGNRLHAVRNEKKWCPACAIELASTR